MDQRDRTAWVAIELTKLGEQRVEEGTLEGCLLSDLGVDEDWDVFIPACTYTKSGKSVTVHLIEGYVFVRSGLPEVRYFALESEPYISQVMSAKGPSGMRVVSVVPDRKIVDLRAKLRTQVSANVDLGTKVEITEGVFASLEGIVTLLEEEDAVVEINFRSLKRLVPIPYAFLEPIDPSPPDLDLENPPTAKTFYDPVVKTLGGLVNYRPNLFVKMSKVVTKTLSQEFNLDIEGVKSPKVKALKRRVGWAFRNQREGYCSEPLTLQGPKRGEWGLTERGVEEARRLSGKTPL